MVEIDWIGEGDECTCPKCTGVKVTAWEEPRKWVTWDIAQEGSDVAVLETWLRTNVQGAIERILAPATRRVIAKHAAQKSHVLQIIDDIHPGKEQLVMETEDIPTHRQVSLWEPITDEYIIAIMGKLGEECNELSGHIFRCLIQGLDELHTDGSGKTNRQRLQDEIADVCATMSNAITRLDLNRDGIEARVDAKTIFGYPWYHWLWVRKTGGKKPK